MNTKKQINIFIVEDNETFALALKANIETTFANKPIKIQSFATGETCMENFNHEKPKVVILDYHLNSKNPDAMDGIKVLDWIKKRNSDTNVIMLTSNDNIDIALKSFRHDASDYVVKTETVFAKINYSLFYLLKMMEAKSNAKIYKNMVIGIVLCVVLLIIGILAIQIFNPSFLT